MRIDSILNELDLHYPNTKCFLDYETDWQLLIATILSAQCTDDRVNIVTKSLFSKYKTLNDFANAELAELEADIKSTGFYHNKAKNIKSLANVLTCPLSSNINELIKLPGVGRKTANVILSHIHNIPSIVVDTHVKRVSKRLRLTQNDNPDKIEFDLMRVLPKTHWIRFNLQVITHGRSICKARKPLCNDCFLNSYCDGEKLL